MAENEILDLGGRRWQRTRAALVNPNLSLTAIAECVAEDLQRAVHLQLAKALRSGHTLLTVLQATEQHPAALRAAVESFQDQRLARIARDAISATASKDPADIARCAVNMLLDGVMDKLPALAGRSGCFQEGARRDTLLQAVQQSLDARRDELAAVIEASLRGQPVRQLRRPGAARRQAPMDAKTLVNSPLVVLVRGANHVFSQN